MYFRENYLSSNQNDKSKFKQMEKLTEVDWEKFKKAPYPKKKEKDNSSTENQSQQSHITFECLCSVAKIQDGTLQVQNQIEVVRVFSAGKNNQS